MPEAEIEFQLRTDYWVFQKNRPENFGQENFWTLVYDEGIFIKHSDLSLFAFFKYSQF